MPQDMHGLPISTSAQGARAFDRALMGYLKYRADTGIRVKHLLEVDHDFAMAHCMSGYLAMLSYKQGNVPLAADAARTARRLAANATPRERAHVAALDTWIGGDLDRTLNIWEQILSEHPRDVLAFRLAHFNNFWLGRPDAMRASVERVKPRWNDQLLGYGTILSCHSFALEECGDYASAERSGRAAIEIDPGDVWGTHAVAHIMEMQGRHAEGIAWLEELERNW